MNRKTIKIILTINKHKLKDHLVNNVLLINSCQKLLHQTKKLNSQNKRKRSLKSFRKARTREASYLKMPRMFLVMWTEGTNNMADKIKTIIPKEK